MNLTAIFSVFSVFIGASLIVFGFIYFMKKSKNHQEELQLRKDMLELEIRKEQIHLELIREENRKLDRIIEHKIDSSS